MKQAVGVIILIFAIISAFALLGAWIFMVLWNWIVAGIFNAPALTYWPAVGVCALLAIIGSFFRNASK
jgi:hypothetical protein